MNKLWIWIKVDKPEQDIANRQWYLCWKGFSWTMKLPIRYKNDNEFWLNVERKLLSKNWKWIDIAY